MEPSSQGTAAEVQQDKVVNGHTRIIVNENKEKFDLSDHTFLYVPACIRTSQSELLSGKKCSAQVQH